MYELCAFEVIQKWSWMIHKRAEVYKKNKTELAGWKHFSSTNAKATGKNAKLSLGMYILQGVFDIFSCSTVLMTWCLRWPHALTSRLMSMLSQCPLSASKDAGQSGCYKKNFAFFRGDTCAHCLLVVNAITSDAPKIVIYGHNLWSLYVCLYVWINIYWFINTWTLYLEVLLSPWASRRLGDYEIFT